MTNSSKKYINKEAFEQYKNNEAKKALSVLGINLVNNNKLNQFASRALGFSCYEALQPSFEREYNIRNNFHIEKCPIQNGRTTIKSKNVIVVVDNINHIILGKALSNGEDFLFIDEDNADAIIYVNSACEAPFNDIMSSCDLSKSISTLENSTGIFPKQAYYKILKNHGLSICQSSEGLIIDLWYNDDEIDSVGLSYSDADDEYDKVDLITPSWGRTISCTDGRGTCYKWQHQVTTEGFNGEVVRTFVDLPRIDEISISSILFDSESAAINAINNEDFGVFDVSGASVVKVTTQFVSNPHIKTEE